MTPLRKILAAVVLTAALLAQASPAIAYPPPGQTITVSYGDCVVSYQQGYSNGAYAKFIAGSGCNTGSTRVTVWGVKGVYVKVKTCYYGGPCLASGWWRAQHLSGVTFRNADLRLCYDIGTTEYCRIDHFYP